VLAACVNLALALATAVTAGCASVAPAPPPAPPVIAVTGHGEVMVRPDTALVLLGAEARRTSVAAATADVARRMSDMTARLAALGIRPEDVTTVEYLVTPIPSRQRPEPDAAPAEIAGYHVANIARVRVRDLSALGRVVDAAMAAGANAIRNVQFVLADPAAARTAARTRAVEAARAAAADLARAAGVRLGALLTLSEGAAVHPAERFTATALHARAPGPIEAGELTVSVTVEARYRLETPAGDR
jgi:uncharacterized protein YggE